MRKLIYAALLTLVACAEAAHAEDVARADDEAAQRARTQHLIEVFKHNIEQARAHWPRGDETFQTRYAGCITGMVVLMEKGLTADAVNAAMKKNGVDICPIYADTLE
jgi:hypothetical protein